MGLNEILPAKVRQVLYAVYAFLGLGLGATQVAYSSAGTGQPEWLTVTLAVFAFVGVALGFTAAANTSPTGVVEPYIVSDFVEPGAVASDEDAAQDVSRAAGVVTPMNWGTEVTLTDANPSNGWIKARNMLGTDKILHEGETANNVAKFMPPGTNWRMRVTGPNGTTNVLAPGQAYVPNQSTAQGSPYRVVVEAV